MILKKLGKNHTNPIEFKLVKPGEVYGLYTLKGNVYVFKEGMDIDYEDLSDSDKLDVLNKFKSGKWIVNKNLQ